ncbi:alpha/beta hydrolase [Sphingomonas sp. 28-63-12]|uniref:alpha/beta hydrolase n=1 Tax=Sphingomonas sp. 28-63-12 TaxID=1970434 RepID=UPI000BDA6EEF|nr:MAG: alpha/beta hydrolase [Sphingomonas sp. 28-63-12]
MQITRHFADIGPRRVHYRRCGAGPVLLMVHQSPRSSAEYEALMHNWGTQFTCIAPDTPGFGQSDPLSGDDPSIEDFADAIVALIDALGIGPVAAYGFHSGGIILVTALKRHPEKFRALAIGGYAIWTPQEVALFGEHYLPPFLPSSYGEHLTWLWNRMLEQSWFFPWFDVRPETWLSGAHADVARVDAAVREMLNSGAAYRAGYGAVLRAPRDIPPVDAVTPPVLITAYDGDPLQAHIDRLGAMPKGWAAAKVACPAEHHAASLAFLKQHASGDAPPARGAEDEGFVAITTDHFAGLIHWRGRKGGAVILHPPGSAADLTDPGDSAAIDLPGHGLSDAWPSEPPESWPAWQQVIDAAAEALGATSVILPAVPPGNPELLFPDLTPDRFGSYLTRAWAIVRARHFFDPWYEANAAHARHFDLTEINADMLAREHRALIRATAARPYLIALRSREGES